MTEQKVNVKKILNASLFGIIIVFVFMLVSNHSTNIAYCEHITFSTEGSCTFNIWHELCTCNGESVDPKDAEQVRSDINDELVKNYMIEYQS